MMPNFLILGAARAGTSSLYRYLGQHPQIYMSPIKETNFFALEGVKLDPDKRVFGLRKSVYTINAYRTQFQGVSDEIAIGEASPLYLYSSRAPSRIRHYVPNVRLVAILRDPVDRAYSHWVYNLRRGRDTVADFVQALWEQERRMADNLPWWELPLVPYIGGGLYNAQLKRYFDLFNRDQISVYLYEDLRDDTLGLLQRLFRFLGVRDSFVPDASIKHNTSSMLRPGMKRLYTGFSRLRPLKSLAKLCLSNSVYRRVLSLAFAKPPISPEVRKELVETFRVDILELQDLIRCDLSKWLE